jgi:hypothetical protein
MNITIAEINPIIEGQTAHRLLLQKQIADLIEKNTTLQNTVTMLTERARDLQREVANGQASNRLLQAVIQQKNEEHPPDDLASWQEYEAGWKAAMAGAQAKTVAKPADAPKKKPAKK